MRNTKEVVLDTYAHFLPDDDDGARQIMNALFRAADGASSTGSFHDHVMFPAIYDAGTRQSRELRL